MAETEGVIKFDLRLSTRAPQEALQDPSILEHSLPRLNQLRSLCRSWDVMGQESGPEARYGGYGFGNISMRLDGIDHGFWVSASQTSGLESPQIEDWALVTRVDLQSNALWATGLAAPSSEAMTHAAVYQAIEDATCVVHGHHEGIWRALCAHNQSRIDHAQYGTVEMAQAVEALLHKYRSKAFAMVDHQDGFVVWGTSIEKAQATLAQLIEACEAGS